MPKKIDIWMPLFIGDYLSATTHLQTPQHGAYLLLLFSQWKTGKGIPGDVDSAIQIAGARPFFVDASSITQEGLKQAASIRLASDSDDVNKLRAWMFDLLDQFFVRRSDGRWENPRGAREREIWLKRQENFHERGVKGAAGRWADHVKKPRESRSKNADASSIATKMLMQSPSPSPSRSKNKYQRDFVSGSERSDAPKSSGAPSSSTPSKRKPATPPIEPPPPGPKPGRSTPKPAGKSASPKKATTAPPAHSGRSTGANKPKNAVKVPKKSVASDMSKSGDAKKPTPPPDRRFGDFRGEIFKYWASIHKAEIHGGLLPGDPPWGTRERVELGYFMAANPALELKMLIRLLFNRARSHANHADPPYKWIKDLMKYASGPLNKFNQPMK